MVEQRVSNAFSDMNTILIDQQSRTHSPRRKNMDMVQSASILGLHRFRNLRMERRSITHRRWFNLAASVRLLCHRFLHLGSRCRGNGKTWRPISHWVPRSLSICDGDVWLDVFRLHPSRSWRDLVWHSVFLRSELVVDLSALHLWLPMGRLAKHASTICGRDFEAAALFLSRVVDGASLRTQPSNVLQ